MPLFVGNVLVLVLEATVLETSVIVCEFNVGYLYYSSH